MKVISNPNKNPVSDGDRNQKVAEPGFGKYYTDNMVIAHWSESDGWQDAGCLKKLVNLYTFAHS